MLLAYASVRWWRVFTAEQCAGINRFVAVFAVPLLSFEFISRVDPFRLNLPFLAADVVSKVLILAVALAWAGLTRRGTLDWAISAFSLSSLPNTLVMGIPLLKAMYGDDQEELMVQVVMLQCFVWYTLLLFLFEYRAAARSMVTAQDGRGDANVNARESVDEGSPPEAEDANRVVVGIAVARRNLELDQMLRTGQVQSKVVPDYEQPSVHGVEGGRVRELRISINTQGCSEQARQDCGGNEEVLEEKETEAQKGHGMARAGVEKSPGNSTTSLPSSLQKMTMIMRMVLWKLVKNPNSYTSILGLSWALVSSRWGIEKPQILENSVAILSNAGLGMAMFSLGLFMAMQPRIVACGYKLAALGMLLRFAVGPVTMGIASVGVGMRGEFLKLSIVQASLPQGIVTFVFAREYNVHPDVLSTAVIFGMIVSLPITVLYYALLSFYEG